MPFVKKTPVMIFLSFYFATILLIDSFQVSAYKAYSPSKRRGNRTLNPINKQTDVLFKILDDMPDNQLFRSQSCDLVEQELPDFRTQGRRISEVKCLEQLWRMRFYDQLLLKKVRCKSGVEGAYVSFAIYKGNHVDSAKFPHVGAIGWRTVNDAWIFLCGSALISDRFMITAAHCSRSPPNDERVADPLPKIVRLGESRILDMFVMGKQSIQDANIKNFIVHDDYHYPLKYFDVAIIELEDSVPLRFYSSQACIWSKDDVELSGEAYETGWGVVKSDETHDTPIYKVAKVNLIPQLNCSDISEEKFNKSWADTTSHQICSNYNSNDTYQGDSGGPLVMPIINPGFSDFSIHYIIGIQSMTSNDLGVPNTYTKVSSFIDWIEDIVWGDEDPVRELLSEKNFPNIYGALQRTRDSPDVVCVHGQWDRLYKKISIPTCRERRNKECTFVDKSQCSSICRLCPIISSAQLCNTRQYKGILPGPKFSSGHNKRYNVSKWESPNPRPTTKNPQPATEGSGLATVPTGRRVTLSTVTCLFTISLFLIETHYTNLFRIHSVHASEHLQ